MTPRPAGAAVALALLLTGCGTTPDAPPAAGPGAASGPSTGSGVSGQVTVLAAASLTTPFTALAASFEKANPGTTVRLSFGSSTTLAQQIAQGADADLYASAGTTALQQLGDVEPTATVTLARNTLEIATPAGDPAHVRSVADLARKDVDVVLCAASVPCGRAADEVLAKAGVEAHVVSREIDVSAALSKVTLDEADAAVVYHSDVVSAGSTVAGVAIPAAQNVTLTYPLLRFGDDPATAAFAAYLAGPEGTRVLGTAGFLTP
ncbi:molybdate ABC transporter substrate-binding protein [Phycicoccus duodecadis]|uniref:Molybdate transport system substrate-binding protein n=1 Tax=Phycicoccus duodecadis TaxID=173053 RepID=A0A2N3YL55_9MICO|nr:molybdate ABC transporter substrate-binding protein [Phycicoccus duodecadis]PKW27574.1 molybdate transport system substrate-binding protein [Phycicoccus duodecadis]